MSHEDNLSKAQAYLDPFSGAVTGHLINGQFVVPEGRDTFENLTPVDNTRLGDVVAGTVEDVDLACEAAQAAFPAWRDMPGAERKKLLNAFADNVVERAEEIALVESMDCGQPIRFMRQAAIRGAENFRFFADMAPNARDGQALPAGWEMRRDDQGRRFYVNQSERIQQWDFPTRYRRIEHGCHSS